VLCASASFRNQLAEHGERDVALGPRGRSGYRGQEGEDAVGSFRYTRHGAVGGVGGVGGTAERENELVLLPRRRRVYMEQVA